MINKHILASSAGYPYANQSLALIRAPYLFIILITRSVKCITQFFTTTSWQRCV